MYFIKFDIFFCVNKTFLINIAAQRLLKKKFVYILLSTIIYFKIKSILKHI